MSNLTKREEWVLDYLKGRYKTDFSLNGGWVSPTNVGAIYGEYVLGVYGCHSSTGSPICKKLVEKGKLERNEKGHYRYLNNENI